MHAPFVHHIDPVIGSIAGLCFWWYGLSYSLGFLNAHLFLRRRSGALGLNAQSVYELTLLLAVCTLIGGRVLVVFNNEWAFYQHHLALIPAIWLGGLATHGLIGGAAVGVLLFCVIRDQPIRPVCDDLAIAAAIILACGRIGNFIDGQIVGTVTSVPWAVKFPEADGFRHPVVLYDGLKNLLLVPLLMAVRRRGAPPGRIAALFVLLYPMLRIPIDLLRDYPIRLFGLPTGQSFNCIMATVGIVLLVRNLTRKAEPAPASLAQIASTPRTWHRLAFAIVLTVPLVIPSDATRDVPARYASRHPRLTHSIVYPAIGSDLEPAHLGRAPAASALR